MTDHNPAIPNHPACVELSDLVENRILSLPMSAEENARLNRHLQQCRACADFIRWSQHLREFAPNRTDADMDREVSRAVGRFFLEKRGVSKKVVGVALAMAAAALVVAGIHFYSAGKPETTGPAVAMSCTATPPREVLQGVWISFCDQQEPRREVDEAGNLLVVLAEGAVGISADPQRRPMADISVRTTHGEVRVTGTVFTVHRHEDDSRVEVFRGTVSGQPAGRKERAFSVEEGSGAWLSTGRRYGLPGSLPNALVEGLLAVKYASRPSVHGDSTMDTSKPESSADPDAGAKGAKHRAHSPAEVPTLDALLAQARGCMVDQQWVCAADSYRTILKHYSTRWEAMSATISLAKIELRHLGRPAVARDHFAAYRKRYPSGPLMEEAIFGMAECEGRLGNPAAELKLLRAFVAQHPASSLAVKAHRRIAEIEAAAP